MSEWARPAIQQWPNKLSCWNCVHFRIGIGFSRKCNIKDIHILSMSPDEERAENGEVEAEKCPDFGMYVLHAK